MCDVWDITENKHYFYNDVTPVDALFYAYISKHNIDKDKYDDDFKTKICNMIDFKDDSYYRVYKLDSMTICVNKE